MCACEGASPRRNVKNRYRRDVKNRTEQRKEEHLDSPRARAAAARAARAGYILVRTQPKSYNLTSARQASPVSAIGAAQRSLARSRLRRASRHLLSRGPWLRTHRAARPAMLLRRVAPPTQKG